MHAHTLQQEGLKQGTTRPLFRSDTPTDGLMTSEYKAAYVAPFSPQKNSPFMQNAPGTGDSRPWQCMTGHHAYNKSNFWCITPVVQDGSEIALQQHRCTQPSQHYRHYSLLITHSLVYTYTHACVHTNCYQARAAAAVDHVADLLRTEPVSEPVLVVPNYSQVEALGVVADSALKSIRMPDLSELCKLPRPVAPIVTMVKGMMKILGAAGGGTSWRAARAHVLKNRYDLMRLLQKFDKDAPFVTPAALSFCTEPWSQPEQMRTVTQAAYGLATWLQCVHAYGTYT
eukprot:20861-Heterococcus_DN1.PRE.1